MQSHERRADLPYTLWGRRVKPLALAASVACAAITLGPFYTGDASGVFELDSIPGILSSVLAALGVTLFWIGWWLNNGRAVQWGLLIAVGVFAARGALSALTVGFGHPATWIALSWVVGAAGSFLLERVPIHQAGYYDE